MKKSRSSVLLPSRKGVEKALRIGKRVAEGLMVHDAFGAAASVAFWFFLSLIPILIIIGFLVGQVARTRGVDTLVGPLLDLVPETAEGLVAKEVQRLAGAAAPSVAPLGVAGFLWTASSGLHNLMDVFETAARAARRPWWKQRMMALGWVIMGIATSCVLAWFLMKTDPGLSDDEPTPVETSAQAEKTRPPAAPSHADRAPAARPQRSSAHTRDAHRRVERVLHASHEPLLAGTLLLVSGAALLAGFYRYAVERPLGVRRRVWPGAVTAIGSWLVISWGFGEYAVSIANYALYYGGLAAVAVLLVWLYLTSLSLVIGAEVNAQLERPANNAAV